MNANCTLRALGATLLVGLLCAGPLAAQPADGAEPARVLVLGTYHFANPGLDVIRTEVADVLSAVKQEEIGAVVEALARFRPTRIAVEHLPERAAQLDSLYRLYREGRYELARDETEQLGFRLAVRFDHPRMYPIDHRGAFPFGAVMEYAQAHDPEFAGHVQQELGRIAAEAERQQREHTVGEILRLANEPEWLAAGHGMYLRFAAVGAGDTYVGAELLARWYERNIHIFANLQRIVEPGERVLVVIGSGHAPILRELVGFDPRMELVEATDYLP